MTARLKFRHLAVETIYGYWLPAPYAAEVRAKLASNEAMREKALKGFRADLERVSPTALEAELDQHVEGLRAFFKAHAREVSPKPGYAGRFREFVKARQAWLADDDRVARSVRRLSLERMPDIWNDEDAAERFESSFFEDLAARFDDPRRSKIVRVLREELDVRGFPTSEALREALTARLAQGFPDSIWSGEADEKDDEE